MPRCVNLFENGNRGLYIFHREAFGDFEFEPFGSELRSGKSGVNGLENIRLA